MKATYKKHILNFKKPSGTSRGIMTQKETWFLLLDSNGKYGIGECGMLKGLSIDDVPEYESKLSWTCNNIHLGKTALLRQLVGFPSIQFGLEQAFLSLKSDNPFILYPSKFIANESPIAINGLIWMGNEAFMLAQVEQKLAQGFKCIKMKIGAIDFQTELGMLRSIRSRFTADEIELRVDANGAFSKDGALNKLKQLSEYKIHSIEQPIKQNNWETMAELCQTTPLPIALDEELIGIHSVTKKQELLQTIRPQYIILKPSLIGGYASSQEWIDIAKKFGIGWWITSALESNVGLNAIAQWTFTLKSKMPQGLGTGSLFINNIDSPLDVADGKLFYRKTKNWEIDLIN
ncbi:o-succinylbenzoate synthase [Flagellimonas maritima]|uniref:O-succinylbenzoate synthase n=1 Tax=Flagellimonas maritima TaxID=1383885 RepID=A0A2Z4LXB7_9FLAO|nr:o-succinylbenzoate synthase [Allomuricauda aurantiaca]AWX45927.1 o-succinylbenzoate synthase [Allomuricauda aurantiaca]